MDSPCPTNIHELLNFLPIRPKLRPEQRPLCCRPCPEMLPELKNFLGGVVNNLGIGDISCQPMQAGLEDMGWMSFFNEVGMDLYCRSILVAIRPIVQAIAEAAGLPGRTGVLCDSFGQTVYSQPGDFNIAVEHRWLENGQVRKQRVLVCSNEVEAYSVLLSTAEDFSRPLKLDATKEQTHAKAMAVRLALQMVTAGADYGFIFGGFIAIVARLVHSTDPSNPGTILLFSPAFKLQNETLPDPHPTKPLAPFQANIPTEPFLAILIVILCSNILPQHRINSPLHDLCQPLTLGTIPDADQTEDNVGCTADNEEDTGGTSDLPIIDLQVATNAFYRDCLIYHLQSPIKNVKQGAF
ncbi:hypothetical protein EDD18DRAFT_1179626 [Armillaria luteobubalina]|uniref:Uncharacterized protein n=1 Tax=Armillaria luteobubalina TaxID=153913 RepID=A0AA39Q154_9AGAR|nr:hypothetical protein EDD18DRAFT_1179626 [Armillaria luteobubalina]